MKIFNVYFIHVTTVSFINLSISYSSSSYFNEDYSGWCEVVWDNVMCWNNTRPGTVARLPCPSYITRFTITGRTLVLCFNSLVGSHVAEIAFYINLLL